MRVYLDYGATTPLAPEVIDVMHDVMKNHFGNPSSIHHHGRKSKALIEEARKTIATFLNASIGEIFFTSSATEANNMALHCAVRDLNVKRIISSPTEHHCIFHTLDALVKEYDITVEYLEVDGKGNIDYAELENKLKDSSVKTMVSLMYVNNESGTTLDIHKASEICTQYDVLFHSDTVQGIGKLPLDVQETKLSFLCASAHKFYGPKGVGFIYINGDNQIKPIFHGGAQERNMRAGTENLIGIVGMAKAIELISEIRDDNFKKVNDLRNYMKEGLLKIEPNILFLGNENTMYSPYILNALFPHSPKSDMLSMNLDIRGISASSGSACSSGVEQQTHVLKAMKVDPSRKAVRFSFSHLTSKEELDFTLSQIAEIV